MLQNPFVPTEGQMAYILEISKSNNKLRLNLIPVVEAIKTDNKSRQVAYKPSPPPLSTNLKSLFC